jgi:hypothetical protein
MELQQEQCLGTLSPLQAGWNHQKCGTIYVRMPHVGPLHRPHCIRLDDKQLLLGKAYRKASVYQAGGCPAPPAHSHLQGLRCLSCFQAARSSGALTWHREHR